MDDLKRRLRERADAAAAEGTATATGDALHFREAADAIEALQAKLHDMHRRAQTAEAALREPIEAAAPERRTLGRVMANAAFYAEHDRAEALQAQLAEAREQRDRAIALAEKAQDRLIEAMDRVDEARDKALDDAAMVADGAPYKRGGIVCGCSEGLAGWTAAAIRAMKRERG